MSKATHTGRCQICDRRQKLPSGRLSVHGYTTRFGFFEGTCPGSGHLPFELSIDQIERNIVIAIDQAETLRTQATRHLAGEGDLEFLKYVAATWQIRHSSYVWVKVTLTDDEVVEEDGTAHSRLRHGVRSDLDLRTKRHDAYRHRAGQIDGYVAWQRKRIAGWTVQPLTELD